jgi:1-acyl-sn-glycerol-3-phosphate acyltransferase
MLYLFSWGLFKIILKTFFRLRCIGTENIPKKGGAILAPNHISYFDPPVVGMGTIRQTHYMAKEELFKPRLLGAWMRGVGAFPVRRGTADRKSIRQAIEFLEKGEIVCIFPEGTRSPDGKLQKAELGIGLIAMKSRAPILPMAIIDTDKVLPPDSKKFHLYPIKVVYGAPMTFPDLYDAEDSRGAMEEIGRRVMAAIADLQSKNA